LTLKVSPVRQLAHFSAGGLFRAMVIAAIKFKENTFKMLKEDSMDPPRWL